MKKFCVFFVLVATLLMSCGKDSDKPVVKTLPVTDITETTALVGGNVTADGGAEVTVKGVCWSTSQNPTIDSYSLEIGEGLGDFTSEINGLMPNTTYYVRAFATNKVGTSYGNEEVFTTSEEGLINGYEYVDLGLPSGTKWASCNIGAKSPTEVGHYFAWGDIGYKLAFTSENCSSFGVDLGDISGNPEYDIAAFKWGGSWRMPNATEARELKENCQWEWMEVDGMPGAKVTGPNGNFIFLPAGGFSLNASIDFFELEGAYWISTPDPESPLYYSYFMYFYNDNFCNLGWFSRYAGLSVRPVSD